MLTLPMGSSLVLQLEMLSGLECTRKMGEFCLLNTLFALLMSPAAVVKLLNFSV